MTSLRQSWIDHRRDNPKARTVHVAEALGVSEAELLFSRVGDDATLLRPDWQALLTGLPAVGPVMALTRNARVVHERIGPYETVKYTPHMVGVYGEHIDQRLIVGRWATAIAAPVETRRGVLQSIQVFDDAGTAVLKLYARPETDVHAWSALVDGLADPSPPESLQVTPATPSTDRPDGDIDVPALRDAWAAMTDTHQAHPLLREHRVGRLQAMRLLGTEWATPVDGDTLAELLERASSDAEPIMVFVGNTGSIQIHSGLVKRIVPLDDWLNVMDPDFNLHVRTTGLDSAWIVRKPTDRGLVWSFEAYDADGIVLLQLFGQRTEDRSQADSWHALLADLQVRHALSTDSQTPDDA